MPFSVDLPLAFVFFSLRFASCFATKLRGYKKKKKCFELFRGDFSKKFVGLRLQKCVRSENNQQNLVSPRRSKLAANNSRTVGISKFTWLDSNQ